MSAVDQDAELHASRTAVVKQCIERGADGPSCIEDVVEQDNVSSGYGKIDLSGVEHRLNADGGQIIAVEVDVENANRHLEAFERGDLLRQPLRQGNPTAAYPDESELIEILGFFQNFMSQPHERAVDFRGTHQL